MGESDKKPVRKDGQDMEVIMIHQLKLQASFFEEKIKGLKPWELRLNDRGFKVGDYIGENEVIDKDDEWVETGRFVLERITSIVTAEECSGLQKGWVILTTNPCKVVARGQIFADLDNVYPVYGGDDNANKNT